MSEWDFDYMLTRPQKDLTLLMIDCGVNGDKSNAESVKVFNHCAKQMGFAEKVFVSHYVPEDLPVGTRFEYMPYLHDFNHIAHLHFGPIPWMIRTSHYLSIHRDGFIVKPELWQDSWLDYDYVGGPWSGGHCADNECGTEPTVGDGGFSIRSKRLQFAVNDLAKRKGHWETMLKAWGTPAEDWYIGFTVRPNLEDKGMKFAPVREALKFCQIHLLPEYPDFQFEQSFGFHGYAKAYTHGLTEKYKELVK